MMQKRKEISNSLYFDRYQFCARLNLVEATALRGWTHDSIHDTLARRKTIGINWGGSWRNQNREHITPEVEQKLYQICDIINNSREQVKVMLTSNFLYAYTNDQSLLQLLINFGNECDTLTEIELQGPKDSVVLRQANHRYRSYFRNLRIDNKTSTNLRGFLQVQENLRFSPALLTFFENGWQMSQDYYFIDHDDMSIISMLSMIAPRLIRKTLPIAQHK